MAKSDRRGVALIDSETRFSEATRARHRESVRRADGDEKVQKKIERKREKKRKRKRGKERRNAREIRFRGKPARLLRKKMKREKERGRERDRVRCCDSSYHLSR